MGFSLGGERKKKVGEEEVERVVEGINIIVYKIVYVGYNSLYGI